jgi:hypothetical protein
MKALILILLVFFVSCARVTPTTVALSVVSTATGVDLDVGNWKTSYACKSVEEEPISRCRAMAKCDSRTYQEKFLIGQSKYGTQRERKNIDICVYNDLHQQECELMKKQIAMGQF